MPDPIRIDDADDPRVGDYFGLKDPEARRRTERAAGIFVAEGFNVLGRLLASPYPLRSVLLLPGKVERVVPLLAGLDVPVYVAERDVLERMTGFDLHRGVIASADRGPEPDLDSVLHTARSFVVLEGLNDAENLGAIARSARALGADAMLLDERCADPLARRSVRVSMGEILHLPFVRLDPLPAGLERLRAAGVEVAALTPGAGSVSIHDWRPAERVAVLLGAEGPGLSEAAMAAASLRVRIPIRADVDSLNVGHAAAVALAIVSGRRA